jgi:hypothetical protein
MPPPLPPPTSVSWTGGVTAGGVPFLAPQFSAPTPPPGWEREADLLTYPQQHAPQQLQQHTPSSSSSSSSSSPSSLLASSSLSHAALAADPSLRRKQIGDTGGGVGETYAADAAAYMGADELGTADDGRVDAEMERRYNSDALRNGQCVNARTTAKEMAAYRTALHRNVKESYVDVVTDGCAHAHAHADGSASSAHARSHERAAGVVVRGFEPESMARRTTDMDRLVGGDDGDYDVDGGGDVSKVERALKLRHRRRHEANQLTDPLHTRDSVLPPQQPGHDGGANGDGFGGNTDSNDGNGEGSRPASTLYPYSAVPAPDAGDDAAAAAAALHPPPQQLPLTAPPHIPAVGPLYQGELNHYLCRLCYQTLTFHSVCYLPPHIPTVGPMYAERFNHSFSNLFAFSVLSIITYVRFAISLFIPFFSYLTLPGENGIIPHWSQRHPAETIEYADEHGLMRRGRHHDDGDDGIAGVGNIGLRRPVTDLAAYERRCAETYPANTQTKCDGDGKQQHPPPHTQSERDGGSATLVEREGVVAAGLPTGDGGAGGGGEGASSQERGDDDGGDGIKRSFERTYGVNNGGGGDYDGGSGVASNGASGDYRRASAKAARDAQNAQPWRSDAPAATNASIRALPGGGDRLMWNGLNLAAWGSNAQPALLAPRYDGVPDSRFTDYGGGRRRMAGGGGGGYDGGGAGVAAAGGGGGSGRIPNGFSSNGCSGGNNSCGGSGGGVGGGGGGSMFDLEAAERSDVYSMYGTHAYDARTNGAIATVARGHRNGGGAAAGVGSHNGNYFHRRDEAEAQVCSNGASFRIDVLLLFCACQS